MFRSTSPGASEWIEPEVRVPPRRTPATNHLCPPLRDPAAEPIIIPPPFKPEVMERYLKQLDESDGFDVDFIPGMEKLTTWIVPTDSPELYAPHLSPAIAEFNQHGKAEGRPPISLVRVIKLNSTFYPRVLYFTFVAKDVPGGTERTYQAKVYAGSDYVCALFLREKPSSDAQGIMFSSASADSSEWECDESKVWTPPRRSYETRHLRPSVVSSAWDASNVWIPPRRSYETRHLCPPLAEDGCFIIPIPPFKPEDMERYRRQVHESEGFDVDWIPGMEKLTTYIRPSPFPEIYVPELLAAIDEFNQLRQAEGRPSISLVRVIKLNTTIYPRILWFTLVAKDVPGGTERTYQAKVYAGHERVRSLIFLREKPSIF